jgi:hypothetical protein
MLPGDRQSVSRRASEQEPDECYLVLVYYGLADKSAGYIGKAAASILCLQSQRDVGEFEKLVTH